MNTAAWNSTFRNFALMLLGHAHVEGEVPFPEALNRPALDGSIESLGVLDEYLAHVQPQIATLTPQQFNNVAMRCGAYVGECIRMTWPEAYDWTDYNEHVSHDLQLRTKMPERTLENCAILLRNFDVMLLPVDRVVRYLKEGPEHSVHAFAESERQHHKES